MSRTRLGVLRFGESRVRRGTGVFVKKMGKKESKRSSFRAAPLLASRLGDYRLYSLRFSGHGSPHNPINFVAQSLT
jgi:hypothetical protein